ncbi:MAG: hypothetical protein ACF788_08945 [Novipirellula sp. JB048]
MPRLAIASAAAILAFAGSLSASPLVLEPLIENGQTLEGLVGTVWRSTGGARINNSGQWTATVQSLDKDTGMSPRYVISHDGILVDPYATFDYGDGITLDFSIGLHSAINNKGDVAFGIGGLARDANGNSIGFRSAIVTDTGVVVRSGDQTPFGGVYPTNTWGSRIKLNDRGEVLSSFDIGLTLFNGPDAVIGFVPNPDGGYTSVGHAAQGRPFAEGYSATAANSFGSQQYDLNNNGDVAIGLTLIGENQTNEPWVALNANPIHTSGEVPLFGGSIVNLGFTSIAVNDLQQLAFFGSLVNEDWETFRWAVFRDDFELVWVDDGQTPLMEGRHIGQPRSIQITNSGDVFWISSFDDSLGLTHDGLFRNGELLISSDKSIEEVLHLEGFGYDLSDDGNWMIVESQASGIFRVQIPTPSTCLSLLVVCALSGRARRRGTQV